LNILEDFLMDFPGVILIVSHDRFLLDKLCDHLFIFEGKGQIRDFNGRYAEYRIQQKKEEREEKRSSERPEKQETPAPARTSFGMTSKQKNELKKLEREIQDLEQR
ncbi:hypothetical protein RZS08_44300, partial [Arthrospira platensis SPKY1]|nr:hypothetical protein [Arthrospira platensis SPKY1]